MSKSNSKRTIFVLDTSYPVIERPGYIKADLHGFLGWNSVWAESYTALVRRIKQARSGGQ